MNKKDIDNLYESITPSEDLKEKILKKQETPQKKTMSIKLRRLIPTVSACVILVTILLLSTIFYNMPHANTQLIRFSSYSQAEKYISDELAFQRRVSSSQISIGCGAKGDSGLGEDGEQSNGDYSDTNVQVTGVDESDYVKTNGTHIYSMTKDISTRSSISILTVATNTIKKIEIFERTEPLGLYLDGDALVAVFDTYDDLGVLVNLYDISDANQAILKKSVRYKDVDIVSTRKIDNKLYFIMRRYRTIIDTNGDLIIPSCIEDGKTVKVSPEDMYALPGGGKQGVFTFISVFDIDSFNQKQFDAYFGSSEEIYVNKNAIYIASRKYEYSRNAFGVYELPKGVSTTVNRFSISESGVSFHSVIDAEGYILNQFAMDEYENTFRIATTKTTGRAGSVSIYDINDDSMTLVSSVDGMGAEQFEQIYSVRYDKNYCYVVTARQTDPLYVVDMTNKNEIKVKGELKIPDVSDYMHMYDENTIIGVGRRSYGGNFSGVQVTLFDVTNKSDPKSLHQVKFSTSSSTAVSKTHKAFLYYKMKNGKTVFGIPVIENSKEYYVLFETDGKLIIKVGTLNLGSSDFMNMTRGVIISNKLYAVSTNQIVTAEVIQDENGAMSLGDSISIDISDDNIIVLE